MIADIALLCDSPIVLIDEIENAGIDKERALGLLSVMTSWCWWSPMTRTPP